MKIRLEFKSRDLWIGLYWEVREWAPLNPDGPALHVWICLLPMLPIHIVIPWRARS